MRSALHVNSISGTRVHQFIFKIEHSLRAERWNLVVGFVRQ